MFYVAPLFLIALMLWIERGCPRPPLIAVPAAIAAVALPVALPYTKLIGLPAVSDTPALARRSGRSRRRSAGSGTSRWVVARRAALATALLFLFVPAALRARPARCSSSSTSGSPQKPIEGKYRQTSILDLVPGDHRPAPRLGRPRGRPRCAGHADLVGQHRPVLACGRTSSSTAACGTSTTRARRSRATSPRQPLTTDRADRPDARARTARSSSRSTCSPTGRSTSAAGSSPQDERKGIVLRRIDGPLRQVSRVDGLYPQDTWSGRAGARTRASGCRGGSVAVTLQSDPVAVHRSRRP